MCVVVTVCLALTVVLLSAVVMIDCPCVVFYAMKDIYTFINDVKFVSRNNTILVQ